MRDCPRVRKKDAMIRLPQADTSGRELSIIDYCSGGKYVELRTRSPRTSEICSRIKINNMRSQHTALVYLGYLKSIHGSKEKVGHT
jgi:hypothetical protein